MVDSPTAMKKTFSVQEIKPLDQYDFNRAKIRASVRWLLSKSYGSAENVPVELREPLYKDQYGQEHLKPAVSKLLLSLEIYCRVQALLAQAHGVSLPAPQGSPADSSALLQLLTKKGFTPKVQDADVTEEDLSKVPIKMKSHLALIDALMSLAAKETAGRVKMAAEAEQIGVGAPWENALLFWVNRLNQKLRESTEEEESPKPQTCTDLQPAQEMCQSTRWYWKLVPIRYRKDKVQSKLTPTFPLVSAVKDLSNGCAIAAVLHYYCPSLLPLEDVCLKDTMSVADSLYNLQLIKEFCESSLQSCCLLVMEDLLYAPPLLHLNIMSFIAELLEWFEVKKPDFVQPIQPIDLTGVAYLHLMFHTGPWTIKLSKEQWYVRQGLIDTSLTASVLNLLAIAVERHQTIFKMQLHSKMSTRRVFIIMLFIWVVAIFMGLIPTKGWNCLCDLKNCSTMVPLYSRSYLVFWAVLNLVTFSLMVAVYTRIFVYVRHKSKQMSQHTSQIRYRETVLNLMKTVSMILGCFVICWTPGLVLLLLDGVGCERCNVLLYEKYFLVLAECNSFFNPIIYSFRDTDMRRTFKEILCYPCQQGKTDRGNSGMQFNTLEREVLSESNGGDDCSHKQNSHSH